MSSGSGTSHPAEHCRQGQVDADYPAAADTWTGTMDATLRVVTQTHDYTVTASTTATFVLDLAHSDPPPATGELTRVYMVRYTLKNGTVAYTVSGIWNKESGCSISAEQTHDLTNHDSGDVRIYYAPPGSPYIRSARASLLHQRGIDAVVTCQNPPSSNMQLVYGSDLFDTGVTTDFKVTPDGKVFAGTHQDGSNSWRWNLRLEGGEGPQPPLVITADKDETCPNDVITFRLEGSSSGTLRWEGDGNPATGTGSVFTTRFATAGDHAVQATLTTSSGTQTASKQVHIKELSGRTWVDRFPGSRSTTDLVLQP